MQKPGVHLVSEAIDHVESQGVVTADGTVHELDLLVLATGFDARAYVRPMEIVGENGLTLDEAWADGPHAYRSVAVPGFPNLFMLMGPHSPIGNQSLVIDRRGPGRLRDVVDQPDPRGPCHCRGADGSGYQGLQRAK